MTSRDRHAARDRHAERNGYRSQPVPGTPPWATLLLSEAADEQAARAALALRGLPTTKEARP